MAFDVIVVGGGLSGALCALALLARAPTLRIALVERAERLGLAHTWCFHAADVNTDEHSFVEPLIAHRWPGYSVHFPDRARHLNSAYACVTGARLHDVVTSAFAKSPRSKLFLTSPVRAVERTRVELERGEVLDARLVIDARGPERTPHDAACGYQKFVGLELEVEPSHSIHQPVLMDATMPQNDGLRFMYVLPFAANRILVEETYFSDTPQLNEKECEGAILAYAREQGLSVRGVLRRETGILPMPWRGVEPTVPAQGPLIAGYAGGWFHPVTGYSFPIATRYAGALAESVSNGFNLEPLHVLARDHAAQLSFLFSLTHKMFRWFAPEQRYSVLSHFYRLSEPLIERFYAARLTTFDRARIFLGPPPRGLSMRRMLANRVEATL